MDTKSDFVASRKQIKRMARIVSLLKREDRTSAQILKDLDESSNFGTTDISCSARTLRHDIEILKKEYNCPVEFDFAIKKYVLYNKNWEFTLPSVLNNNELLAIVIGEKFSKDILPPNISRSVTDAVNEVIRSNITDDSYFSSARLNSLKILTESGECLPDEIFSIVFDAWRSCHRLLIDYRDGRDELSQRIIEPHALCFYDMQWSIQAFCPDKKQWRTFLMNRIDRAYLQDDKFIQDDKTISRISADNYFNFASIGKAKIKLTRQGMQFARAHMLRSKQQITAQDMNTYILTVSDVSVQELTQWIFRQQPGDAIPLSPPQAIDAIRNAAQKILDSLK